MEREEKEGIKMPFHATVWSVIIILYAGALHCKSGWKVKVCSMNDGAKSVILARNLCLHDITNLPGATTYLLSSNLLFWSI